ncbi:microtubule-associated protein 1B-like [Eurosta solidaginis]|uniref:microtubule-associated protein 1B-like n=1 Tax=Eurosta solidaginis TaxID=178769 RepID=UPI003530F032
MDSLFDQLKSAPPVSLKSVNSTKKVETSKATKRSPSPISKKDTTGKIKKKKVENSTMRRESMPPPATTFVTKVKNKKSRSLSPAKDSMVRQFKVLLERKKLDGSIDNKISNKTHSKTAAKTITTKTATTKATTSHKRLSQDDGSASPTNIKNGEKSPKKATPTKAQQKLFDPAVLVKAQQLKQLKVKCCKVRIKRQNLKKLKREFHAKQNQMKNIKINNKKSSSPSKQSKSHQRDGNYSPSPPKRGRHNAEARDAKHPSGFFIKINALTKSPKSQKVPKSKMDKSSQDKMKSVHKFSIGSIAKRVNAAAAVSSTKPTKFTRTQLIKMYGKRVFCSRVKIERCAHPMMLIFESNARARRLQSKRSKSKNLSVSFRDQVEIFGDSSDSEEPDTSQMFIPDVATTSQAAAALKSANSSALSITATPARLKKIENGKVVDDIELDPSLFVAPTIASTPFPASTAARKKREKKSFSPLKGDGAPSPRKEQLKLANEKMPPSSLRRLTADEAEEEDEEDEECEYIVPVDIPDIRTPRISSANAFEEDEAVLGDTEPEAESTPMNISDVSTNISSVNNSSAESFASAVEQPIERDTSEQAKTDKNDVAIENITTNGGLTDNVINDDKCDEAAEKNVVGEEQQQEKERDQERLQGQDQEHDQDAELTSEEELPKLTRLASETPSPSFLFNHMVDSLINNVADDTTGNANEDGINAIGLVEENISNGTEGDHNTANDVESVSEQIMPIEDAKSVDNLNDDISLQMFVDDDNTPVNSTFLEDTAIKDSEIVDGIVKERIDEISAKDKQLDSTNEATTQNNLLSSNITAE